VSAVIILLREEKRVAFDHHSEGRNSPRCQDGAGDKSCDEQNRQYLSNLLNNHRIKIPMFSAGSIWNLLGHSER
jgi:hypothetical protein